MSQESPPAAFRAAFLGGRRSRHVRNWEKLEGTLDPSVFRTQGDLGDASRRPLFTVTPPLGDVAGLFCVVDVNQTRFYRFEGQVRCKISGNGPNKDSGAKNGLKLICRAGTLKIVGLGWGRVSQRSGETGTQLTFKMGKSLCPIIAHYFPLSHCYPGSNYVTILRTICRFLK